MKKINATALMPITRLKNEKKAVFAVGYIIPVIFYMKYLASHAGNAIYPIYWNFLAGKELVLKIG